LPAHLHEENRLAWNEATRAHNSHKGDQARALREGAGTLHPEELELLGDLRGLTLLHLQCNSGQDTLSLARLGATVTGVDISDEAISFAEKLSAQSGIPGRFIRADVYDWFEEAAARRETFDRVFCSYGVLMWLSDIARWGRGVGRVLAPGGRFVVVDYHPAGLMFDRSLKRDRSYFGDGTPYTESPGVGDYVAESKDSMGLAAYEPGVLDFKNPHRSHEFNWGIGQIVTALLDAGLRLEVLREYPYANNSKLYDDMVVLDGRRSTLPPEQPALPLMFGIAARRPADT
jgi:SAM-dependent methyltransferase